MSWKDQLDRAVAAVKEAGESDQARRIASKAKATAQQWARKAKEGALDGAEAFVEANSDPAAVRVHFGNVKQLSGSTYDQGAENGINLVIIKV